VRPDGAQAGLTSDEAMPEPGISKITPESLCASLDGDPEFVSASRYWTVRLRLEVGPAVYNLRIVDGRVEGIHSGDTGFDPYDIVLRAPVPTWAEILAPVPRPFFQDFWSAMARHDFRMEGDLDALCAYYGAIRRLGDIMRALANGTPLA
jgi:hypothetical protein